MVVMVVGHHAASVSSAADRRRRRRPRGPEAAVPRPKLGVDSGLEAGQRAPKQRHQRHQLRPAHRRRRVVRCRGCCRPSRTAAAAARPAARVRRLRGRGGARLVHGVEDRLENPEVAVDEEHVGEEARGLPCERVPRLEVLERAAVEHAQRERAVARAVHQRVGKAPGVRGGLPPSRQLPRQSPPVAVGRGGRAGASGLCGPS
mmetsp:Transcript_45229/g.102129  ORF Transcript_45229/g.102129 Transcript_45229/m.102129 type:complete len:203 (+) Transcript_45229:116-724(+)